MNNLPSIPMKSPSMRLKLWELDHKCHCPLVGVCFDLNEIRKHVSRLIRLPQKSSDFEVHVIAVRECAKRTPLSVLLQKELDRRFNLDIQQAKQAKTLEQLQRHWRVAVEHGAIAGALWAICTHPQTTEALRHQIYGEVHMLQHQVGAHQRAEQRMVRLLREENGSLAREIGNLQERVMQYKDERDREHQEIKKALYDTTLDRRKLERQLQEARDDIALLRAGGKIEPENGAQKIAAMLERTQNSEDKAQALAEQVKTLQVQLADARRDLELMEETLRKTLIDQQAQGPGCIEDCDQCTLSNVECLTLKGFHVLCVGGLNQITPQYRRVVEKLGGTFAHHDGGVEEKIGRLDAAIAAADAVICQTGYVSHNAYWRVKDTCKKTGKPCAFVPKPGLSGFIRSLEEITQINHPTMEIL